MRDSLRPDPRSWHSPITMKRILEIRPAEGGEDSKLLARDLMAAYVRLFERFS